jgi:hypothetical protein
LFREPCLLFSVPQVLFSRIPHATCAGWYILVLVMYYVLPSSARFTKWGKW